MSKKQRERKKKTLEIEGYERNVKLSSEISLYKIDISCLFFPIRCF